MKTVLAPLVGLVAYCSCAEAAEISSFQLEDEVAAIVIIGEITAADARKFKQEAGKHDQALVLLESEGGSVSAAIEIGEAVRLKGFTTAVINGSTCNSACGLIWLAGTPRTLSRSGRVGFHAAYAEVSGRQTESGVANAMVGRYLTLLNLPERAVLFATTAPPSKLSWLTSENYKSTGIDVAVIDDFNFEQSNGQSAPVAASRTSAGTRLWRNLGVWSVHIDPTLADGCFLSAQFNNNTFFRVGFDATKQGKYYILLGNPGWTSLRKGNQYDLTFQFDSEPPWDVPVTVVDLGSSPFLLSTFSDEKFWVEFALAHRLDVSRNGKFVTAISLDGTSTAFDELLRCQKAQLADRKDPFTQ